MRGSRNERRRRPPYLPAARDPEWVQAGAPPPREVVEERPSRDSSDRPVWIATVVVAVVLGVAAFFWTRAASQPGAAKAPPPALPAPPSVPAPPSPAPRTEAPAPMPAPRALRKVAVAPGLPAPAPRSDPDVLRKRAFERARQIGETDAD